jgi:DnaK suppressor protein
MMTEEQLLKMPTADYMNDEQLAFFEQLLLQLKQELMQQVDETTEHLRVEDSVVADPIDRASLEEEHAIELRTRDRERKLLYKVESALSAIKSKDYGFCEETGEPIGLKRLLARPTATLTIEAQTRREHKRKQFSDD